MTILVGLGRFLIRDYIFFRGIVGRLLLDEIDLFLPLVFLVIGVVGNKGSKLWDSNVII